MGLAITREVSESVQIGPDIRIDIIWIRAGQVRLHIEAPKNLGISRGNMIPHPPSLKAGSLAVSPTAKTHPDHGRKE